MDTFTPLSSQNFMQVQTAQDSAKIFALEKKVKSHETKEELKKAAQEFEAVFLNQLFQMMDKTVERNGLISGGPGEDTFRSMLYEKMTQQITQRPSGSGLGLAEAIYRQMADKLGGVDKDSNSTTEKTFSLNPSSKSFRIDQEI